MRHACEQPLAPGEAEPPLALRLSGQLMLGVVKVYARKVQYLQQVRKAGGQEAGARFSSPGASAGVNPRPSSPLLL